MLYRQVLPHVQRLHAEFPFDVIDAHYAFPDGAAAILLAAHFRVPVAVTVRGGDLDLLPRFRLRRRAIAQHAAARRPYLRRLRAPGGACRRARCTAALDPGRTQRRRSGNLLLRRP